MAAAAGEGIVRLVEWKTGRDWSAALTAKLEGSDGFYQVHPFIGFVMRPGASLDSPRGQFSVNSLGYRGAEFDKVKAPGTFRVACLGGSTTWGSGASCDDATWPAALQRDLTALLPSGGPYQRVEVINAGAPGYTLMESFVQLKMRLVPLQPDLVVVYHGINDARVMGRGNFEPDYTHVRRAFTAPVPTSTEILLGWSHLYGLARESFGAREDLEQIIYVPGFETMPMTERVELGRATYLRTLTELVAVARVSGADVLFTTFGYTRELPMKYEWMLDYGFLVTDQLNAATAEVAQRQDVPVADVAACLGGEGKYFVDPVHLNDTGNRMIARCIAQRIQEAGLLKGPVGPKVTRPLGEK